MSKKLRGGKQHKLELQGEFKKINPQIFNDESKEATKEWLVNINKYFEIYEYNDNLKDCLEIYQLQGKANLWLEEVEAVQWVDEQGTTWENFQQWFKNKYLIEIFYDDKVIEFHDLRLG